MLRKYAKKALHRFNVNDYKPLNHIELNRAHLLNNLQIVQQQRPNFQIIPVLKGNAYGHGITEIAEILGQTECELIAVDGYFEAARIRDFIRQRILVMGYIKPENVRLLDTKRCSFVVQDIISLEAFGSLGRIVNIHIELNTGMNRLGIQPGELAGYLKVLKRYPNIKLEGVMTHLADADNPKDDSFDKQQTILFDELVSKIIAAGFQPPMIHIAQTAGSTKIKSRYANAIRLGIGMYGINPLQRSDPHYGDLRGLKPVLELKSTIIKVIKLNKADKVSYGGTFSAPNSMKVGVLPLGYCEGVPRELSNEGFFTHGNKDLPIVGRVCMNHTIIDLRDSGLKVGDEVTVISNDPSRMNSVTGIEAKFGCFEYTTVINLSDGIRRRIV